MYEATEKQAREARTSLPTTPARGLLEIDVSSIFVARCRWEKPVNTIQINGLPLSLAFHAFDPHLVIANESDMITYVPVTIGRLGGLLMGLCQCVGLDQAEETEQVLQRESAGHEHYLASPH